jgi:hypothetical protein
MFFLSTVPAESANTKGYFTALNKEMKILGGEQLKS